MVVDSQRWATLLSLTWASHETSIQMRSGKEPWTVLRFHLNSAKAMEWWAVEGQAQLWWEVWTTTKTSSMIWSNKKGWVTVPVGWVVLAWIPQPQKVARRSLIDWSCLNKNRTLHNQLISQEESSWVNSNIQMIQMSWMMIRHRIIAIPWWIVVLGIEWRASIKIAWGQLQHLLQRNSLICKEMDQ